MKVCELNKVTAQQALVSFVHFLFEKVIVLCALFVGVAMAADYPAPGYAKPSYDYVGFLC